TIEELVEKEEPDAQEPSPTVKVEESTPSQEEDDFFEEQSDGFFDDSKQRALVQKITFSKTPDNENGIAIAVEHLGRYSFVKSAPQSYSLVIENARAEDDTVTLTQFPPE